MQVINKLLTDSSARNNCMHIAPPSTKTWLPHLRAYSHTATSVDNALTKAAAVGVSVLDVHLVRVRG